MNKQLTQKDIERLLSQQTSVILTAVDQKFTYLEKRIDKLEIRIDKMQIEIGQKFDRLITTLDKFLKKTSDLEDEFIIMKADLNRLKKVVSAKLGVELL